MADTAPELRPLTRAEFAPELHEPQADLLSEHSLDELPADSRMVLAIDYGTTYTGVAVAVVPGNIRRAELVDVNIVTAWGDGMGNDDKIRSTISYSDPPDSSWAQWADRIAPLSVAMSHTKIELQIDGPSKELDLVSQAIDGMHGLDLLSIRNRSIPNYTYKGPEEIVEDYLRKLKAALLTALEKVVLNYTEETRPSFATDIVITIPAGWKYDAKNAMFRALNAAGFNNDTFTLGNILTISEPEAAARYAARFFSELRGKDVLRVKDCFILCDAGGGTVDVVSYKVLQVHPELITERMTKPTSKKCGSIFIDREFKKWLKELLGPRYHLLDSENSSYQISSHETEGLEMREVMKKFREKKELFQKGDDDYTIDLPDPLNRDNAGDENELRNGKLKISNERMRSFFRPSLASTKTLIEDQIILCYNKRKAVTRIFLVGGFAESEYLRSEIESWVGRKRIVLQAPDKVWTAVLRGAAIFGIERPLDNQERRMRPCPWSFGIVTTVASFSEIFHNPMHKVFNPISESYVAKQQLVWLIERGDLMLSGEPREIVKVFDRTFGPDEPRKGEFTIYIHDDQDLERDIPRDFHTAEDDIRPGPVLEYDLTNEPDNHFLIKRLENGSIGLQAELTMRWVLDETKLSLSLCFHDREIDSDAIVLPSGR